MSIFSKKPKEQSFQTSPTKLGKQEKYTSAIDWEASRIQAIERSEKRAWHVVGTMGFVIGALSVGIALMLPLKETQPYVIQVDKTTGMTDILSISNSKELKIDEVQDKYWLSQYIRSRESYDYRTVENDFIKTRELSAPTIFDGYAKMFEGAESLEKTLVDKKRIVVDLKSVVPNGNGIATVRYLKRIIDNNSNTTESESLWTATLGYEYKPDFKVSEPNRLINPFGFQVTTYRVDPEMMTPAKKAATTLSANEGAQNENH